MKRFTITQLLLVTTWAAIACVLASRYFASPPYTGELTDIAGTAVTLDSGAGEFYSEIADGAVGLTAKWHPADPNPPVSARAALTIGDRLRRTTLGSDADWTWSLDGLSLKPLDGKNGKWCWKISFSAGHVNPFENNDSRHFSAYVLMNGEVIEPKLGSPPQEPDCVFFNADF